MSVLVKVDRKIPPPSGHHRAKYPWKQLKVGDSFFVDDPLLRGGMYGTARRHGIKVKVAAERNGIRVWRIK